MKKGKNFIVVVAIAKEGIWKTIIKKIMTGNFISGLGLEKYFHFPLKREVGLHMRCLSSKIFKERWMHLARVLNVKEHK